VNFIPKFVKRLKDKEEATPSENVLSKEASIKLISEFASEQETSQAEGGENIRTRTRVFSLKDCGLKIPDVKKMLLYEETQYVIDRMDEISRIAFPVSYIVLQFFYWTYYFYIAKDQV